MVKSKSGIIPIIFTSVAIFLICGAYQTVCGQIKFTNISIAQGLSQTTVFDITQSKNNHLWIGTADGLNRYDSYTFTVYRHRPGDSLSLAGNTVRALYPDTDGSLWVGTTSGLSHYNTEQDRFRNFRTKDTTDNLEIYDIEDAGNNKLLLASNQGLLIFDKASGSLKNSHLISNLKVVTLEKMDQQILVGTASGLYLYTPEIDQINMVVKEFQKYTINAIKYIPYKGLWVGTEGNGLYFTDLNFHITREFRHNAPLSSRRISSDFVRTISLDYEQRLWVGTFDGLNIYNASTNSFDPYFHDIEDNFTISQNSIRTIYPDNQGGIWLGTYFCGLDYYHPLQNKFGLIRQSLKPNSLSDNVISSIVEEPLTGNLWIGTNDNGVNYYIPSQNKFIYFRKDEHQNNTLASNNIKQILPAGDGNAWIGTHGGGLGYIHRASGKIENFTTAGSNIISNNIYTLLSAENGLLWIGSLDGLQLFDTHKREFISHFLHKSHPSIARQAIFFLFRDTENRIWIGTDRNLYAFTPQTGEVETYLSADGENGYNPILCIQEDSAHNIWAGSRLGLFRIAQGTKQITHYTTANGLPNDVVYGIIEDSYNRLWLSTNKGLSCFDIKNSIFRTYTDADGLQSDQFNNYSYCKTSKGVFYFGGVEGITFFIPEHLQDNPFTPQATLSGLTLFNREVKPGDATGLLQKNISHTEKLVFRHDQNFFALHFVAPNFLSAQKNMFRYKLEGFDKDWYTTPKREVTYSNLAPGTYTFHLNVANNDGKWSPRTTNLQIEILPVWYQTTWARAGFLLLLGAIGYVVFKFYRTRLQLSQNEELTQMKVRFFVNITHELRTPLTLIVSPLQEILQRGVADKWLKKQLEYIQKSTDRLLYLVNQTLDYRRAELGVFTLKVSQQPLELLAHDIFGLFRTQSRQKNIAYEFISELSRTDYPVDTNYLERILLNLLSNAFKYTPENGQITLSIRESKGLVVFEVRDSGCGIAKEEQNKVFERFYQVHKDASSSGIGLSLVKLLVEQHHGTISLESEPDRGSAFRVALPATPEAYSPQEWDIPGTEEQKEGQPGNLPVSLTDETLLPPSATETAATPHATILVVDDNRDVVNYLLSGLTPRYKVLAAGNGEEALALMKTDAVDLIITDVVMPGMDGLRFCKTVKQNINTSHISIIMLTARNSVEEQLEGLKNGADDYLSKPFLFPVLNAKIANLLKARQRVANHYLTERGLEAEKKSFNTADEALLKKCRAIVEKHLDQVDFSVDDLSREMGMSRSTLHLKLKSVTGESTIEFIRKIKFDKACQLLQDGRYSIAEISVMVGFNTPSYFTGSFKKQMGCLPTEYIKKMAN